MEREQDRRRLRTSLLISLVLWAVFMPLLSFLRFEGPLPPPESMNPLFVELAPPEAVPPIPPPTRSAAPSDADRVASEAGERSAAASGGGAASARAERAESSAPAPVLHADPSAAPLPAASTRSASPYQGGADPFARLSEGSLRGEEAPAPVPNPAPAARNDAPAAQSSAPPGDAFDRSLKETSERLASGGSGGSSSAPPAVSRGSGTGSSSGSGSGAGPGFGNVNGDFDFGGGATRDLLGSRKIKISDKLLSDQPKDLSFTVSFIVERGGTVLPNTIRFDPLVPRADLEAVLKAAFSSWTFSFADSDGQVVFQYSIKVR